MAEVVKSCDYQAFNPGEKIAIEKFQKTAKLGKSSNLKHENYQKLPKPATKTEMPPVKAPRKESK